MTNDFGIPDSPNEAPSSQSPDVARPSAPPGGPWSRPWSAGLAGLLGGAAVVGACWLISADGKGPTGGTGSRRVSEEPALPESLGSYQRFSKAARSTHAGNADQIARRTDDADEKSTQLLSKAYDGAPAAVATFADTGLSEIFVLTAVAATSPQPFTPYQNAAQLGMAKPPREVVTVGEVACLVYNQPMSPGKKPGPETVNVDSCQRTGKGLTVQIRSVTGDIHSSPERIAALVDKAWSGLS